VYFFARGHANATEVPLTREEAEALVRGDRVRLGHRTGRISEVFPTLVYVQWDAGKQNEAYMLATLLRFELDSPQSEMTFEGHRSSWFATDRNGRRYQAAIRRMASLTIWGS
jgi:hypothetical protein